METQLLRTTICVCLLANLVSTSDTPSAIIRISKKGLEHLNERALAALADEATSLRIGTIEKDLGARGKIIMKDLRIHEFKGPKKTKIELKAEDKVMYELEGLDIGVNGDLGGQVKVILPITLKGRGYMDVKDIKLTTSNRILRTTSGIPKVEMLSCEAKMGHIAMTVKNGGILSSLVTTFRAQVNTYAKPVLETELCKIFEEYAIGQLNEMLRSMPTASSKDFKPKASKDGKIVDGFDMNELFSQMNIEYRMPRGAKVRSSYLELPGIAHVKSFSKTVRRPYLPHVKDFSSRDMNSASSKMLNIWIGEHVPNELLYYAYKRKWLNIKMDKDSSTFGSALSRDCVAFCVTDVVSEIADEFPDHDLIIGITFERAPQLTMKQERTIEVVGNAKIAVWASSKPGRKALILYLNTTATAILKDIKFEHDDENQLRLKGDVRVKGMRIKVRDSRVKGINDGDMLPEVAGMVESLMEQQIAAVLTRGVPILNGDFIRLHNTKVTLARHNLHLSTDVDVAEEVFARLFRKMADNN